MDEGESRMPATGANELANRLLPYVPRLVSEWLEVDPDTRVRELEGTIAFVDISGFTKLAERLAKRGRIGAEILTEELGGTFAELLAVAYEHGGGLLKFGGDALLLWFDGPWHEARACRSAIGMRRTLRDIQAGAREKGSMRLRMSVGIHSGRFLFFLVGASHREAVVAGPAATHVVLMESTATAGQIVMSQATADALARRCWGAERGAGRLLQVAPTVPVSRYEVSRPDTAVDVSQAIPLTLRQHLAAGEQGPEHRQACVAFVSFGDVDAAVGRMELGSMAETLDELIAHVQASAEAHGVSFLGTDVAADAGKIILVAGAPTATGDHEERMLLTLRRILELATPLPLRAGVHQGHVFAGDVGPPYRRTYTVMGDTVNLAARLMAAARPGQILATPSVLARSGASFQTTALTPFLVKGKAQPVQSYIVGPVLTERPVPAGDGNLPLVGRAEELAALFEALDGARRGEGRVIQLTGEAGIGKSRLIDEVLRSATDMVIVSVRTDMYRAATPYGVIAELLGEALAIHGDENGSSMLARIAGRVAIDRPDLMAWLPLLADVLGAEVEDTPETAALEPQFRRGRIADLVSALLEMTLGSPTVLVLDDAHVMDAASAEVLEGVSQDVGSRRWLVLSARRDVAGGFVADAAPHVTETHVAPLAREESVALAERATEDSPLPPHAIEALVDRAAGNPLFLLELIAAAPTVGIESLPASLEDVVTARLDRLAPDERTALRYASVLGTTFTEEGLRTVAGGEPVASGRAMWERLAPFVERGDDGTLSFRQTLVRDAAYGGLPFRKRRELHARFADSLLRSASDPLEVSELLAMHFFQAGRSTEAWRFSRLAGDRATEKYANVEAERFYRRALEAVRRLSDVAPTDVARVQESLGEVTERLGEFPAAQTAYRAARRLLAGDPVAQGRLLLKEAWIPERLGHYTGALRTLARGFRSLEQVEGREAATQRARLMASYAAILRAQGRTGLCAEWARRAIAEAEVAGDRDALGHAYSILSWAYATAGNPEFRAYARRALEIFEELGDLGRQAHVLTYLGAFAYFEGEWDEALGYYQRGKEARERTGDAVGAAYGTINIGEILSDQGHLERAEQLFRSALRVWTAAGYRAGVAAVEQQLARVAARSGRCGEALELYDHSRAEFSAVGDRASVVEINAKVAECQLWRGDAEAALQQAGQTLLSAEKEGGGVHTPMLLRIEGLALFELRDVAGARAALERSLRLARERRASYEEGLTLRALATVLSATGEDGSSMATESAAILDRLGVRQDAEPVEPSLSLSRP